MQESNLKNQQQPTPVKKPDERGGIHLEGFVKIFDPETQEVLVKGRA